MNRPNHDDIYLDIMTRIGRQTVVDYNSLNGDVNENLNTSVRIFIKSNIIRIYHILRNVSSTESLILLTVNEVSRRKGTAKAKLKASGPEERIHLWKKTFREFTRKTSESYA